VCFIINAFSNHCILISLQELLPDHSQLQTSLFLWVFHTPNYLKLICLCLQCFRANRREACSNAATQQDTFSAIFNTVTKSFSDCDKIEDRKEAGVDFQISRLRQRAPVKTAPGREWVCPKLPACLSPLMWCHRNEI